MTYKILTVNCSEAESQSPFSYSTGCSVPADTWTTAGSVATTISCDLISSQKPYTYTTSATCSDNRTTLDTSVSNSDGTYPVTEIGEYIVIS